MSIYQLKPWFRSKLLNITRQLRYAGFTPNQITSCALVFSVIYGIAMFFDRNLFLLFPLFAVFRMALNAIDGLMAVEFNMKSQEGMWLNEVGDIVSDIFLILPFMLYAPFEFILIVLVLSISSEIIGMMGQFKNGVRNYHGPMGKSDRVFMFSIFALFAYFQNSIPFPYFIFSFLTYLLLKTNYNRWKALNV